MQSKYKRAKQALKERFSASIAPGQAQSLADILLSNEDDELLELDLDELLNIYKSSDKFGKMIVFAVLLHRNIAKLLWWKHLIAQSKKVDEARKSQVFSEGIKTPVDSKHNRLKLDINKMQRFPGFHF